VIDAVKLHGVTLEEGVCGQAHDVGFYDESARTPVQAADLLVPGGDHGWVGKNTLGHWAAAVLIDTLRRHDPEKSEPLAGRVVMFAGCGDSARMLAPTLKDQGAVLIFASKERAHAQRLAQAFGGRQIMWEGIYTTIHDVLIVTRETGSGED